MRKNENGIDRGNDRGRTEEREHRPGERSNTSTEIRYFPNKMRNKGAEAEQHTQRTTA